MTDEPQAMNEIEAAAHAAKRVALNAFLGAVGGTLAVLRRAGVNP